MYLIFMTMTQEEQEHYGNELVVSQKMFIVPDDQNGIEIFLKSYREWCTYSDKTEFSQDGNNVYVTAFNLNALPKVTRTCQWLNTTCNFDADGVMFENMNTILGPQGLKDKMLEIKNITLKELEEQLKARQEKYQQERLASDKALYLELKARFEPKS